MNSKLFNDLKHVNLLIQFACAVLKQEIFPLLFDPATAANALVEAPKKPEAAITVREGGAMLYLLLHPFLGVSVLTFLMEKVVDAIIITLLIWVRFLRRVKFLDEGILKAEALHARNSEHSEPDYEGKEGTKAAEDVVNGRP